MNPIGKKIKSLREAKGLSQTKAAEILQINNKTLSDYERDISQPDLLTLKQIANLYGVSTDYILGNDDKKEEVITDDFQFALYGEVKNLTEEQKEDILNIVRIFKKQQEKK